MKVRNFRQRHCNIIREAVKQYFSVYKLKNKAYITEVKEL